jgi:hypothetical protein
MNENAKVTWWTVAQACVWIRMRDLAMVEVLDQNEVQSLALASLQFPGTFPASKFLLAAVTVGNPTAMGRKTRLITDVSTGKSHNKSLSESREPIPREFWETGGTFSDQGAHAFFSKDKDENDEGDEATCWRDIAFDRDAIMSGWQWPAAILADRALPLGEALAELRREDDPFWILAHPTVTVTGLRAGIRGPIDRDALQSSCCIDPATNSIKTNDGMHHWSAVMLESSTLEPTAASCKRAAVSDDELIAWVQPIIDRINADGLQLKREQFIEMVLKFDLDASPSVIDMAWKETAPPMWREEGGGRLPRRKMVDDWRRYLPQKVKQ